MNVLTVHPTLLPVIYLEYRYLISIDSGKFSSGLVDGWMHYLLVGFYIVS